MRLVFVHGMSQEGKDPAALRETWETAMHLAWKKAGLKIPAYQLEMPYYGDTLHKLTEEVRGDTSRVTNRGGGEPVNFTPLEEEWIRAMATEAGVTDAQVRADLGQEVVARGPLNWEWMQGVCRVLERKVPWVSELGVGFVRQVDSYLTRPHIRGAVDELVRPSLTGGRCVVVSHSLGTVVTYTILRGLRQPAQVPLYVTLGSPLGIGAIKANVKPPTLGVPTGVATWLNAADERDYVALYSRLDRDNFIEGIENVSDIKNRHEDAHAIVDYLTDKTVSARIHRALTAT